MIHQLHHRMASEHGIAVKPILRCSELNRLLSCPGSRTLSALVEPRQGDESFEGTAIHWETAWRLVRELGAEQPEGGLPLPALPPDYHLPKFSEWIVGFCFREVKDNTPADWSIEVETPLAYEFDRFILSGHIDANAINSDATEAVGYDYKTGYKPVDPAEFNEQVLGYIVLLKLAYPTLRKGTFHIVQPRNDEDDGFERVSTVVVEGERLEQCAASLEGRINHVLDHPMDIETGLAQCAWCPASVQCPAIQQEIENMKMTLTPEHLATIKREADDALLGDIVIASKVIKRPIEDATDLLKERIAAQGEVIAGSGSRITAKETNGAFKVKDPSGLYQAAKELIHDEAKLACALSFPMGRLTDAIAEQMDIPRTGKAPITAEGIAKARLHPFAEHGKKVQLIFS